MNKQSNIQNKIIVFCKYCGNEIGKVFKSLVLHKQFCSPECKHNYHHTILKCEQCNKTYEILKSRQWADGFYGKKKRKYCPSCVKERRRTSTLMAFCKQCGKEIGKQFRSAVESESAKVFCSNECKHKFYYVTLICEECHEPYEVRRSRQWNNNKYGEEQRKYCSATCRRIAQKRFWNSEEERKQRSERQKGSKNANWRGGKCNYRKLLRSTRDYKDFVKSIYQRDKYICQECGQIGGKLCAHHIQSVALHPELIMNEENVMTLCRECHTKTDNYLVVPKISYQIRKATYGR